jgi:hypothetical protein
LTNLTRNFKSITKDRLFYNQFKYSIGFTLDEASCLRNLDHASIDNMIERRRYWREISQQRWNHNKHISTSIITSRQKDITDKTVGDLHELAEILLNTFSDFKLVVSINHAQVYTNDIQLVDQLDNLDSLHNKHYSLAEITRPPNTIRLKNPKHQYRSYFKISKISEQQKDSLVKFLTNQQDFIRLSPALITWIDGPFHRTQDYFFIDHNEMSWLTMVALVCPGLVRKTQQIISAK